MLRTLNATRYVIPLREGGSVPAIVEAEDDGLYVLKFKGAGQGKKALIAELIGGEIARRLGLKVPELVFMELDPALGRNEPHAEIQELIKSSAGLNLALDFLPGSLAYDPAVTPAPTSEIASAVVWFDSYITNVDRTARNTNMLWWHKQLWLIDHGASLYHHYTWQDYLQKSLSPFSQVKFHVLLPKAAELKETNYRFKKALTSEMLEEIVKYIPGEWLEDDPFFTNATEHRHAYHEFLTRRLEASEIFVEEAINARAQLI